jgi:hypothetical protein
MEKTEPSVRPLSLRHTAAAIARNYGDKGAVVITLGTDGVRIGTENLTPSELREVLSIAIHYSYVFEDT